MLKNNFNENWCIIIRKGNEMNILSANNEEVKIRLGVYTHDEYFDDSPTHAEATFTKEEIEKYLSVSEDLKKDGWFKKSKFDYRLKYLVEDESAEEETFNTWNNSSDVDQLHIRNNGECGFTSVIKHTDIGIDTDPLDLSEMLEAINMSLSVKQGKEASATIKSSLEEKNQDNKKDIAVKP
jgi:hypothetical protein